MAEALGASPARGGRCVSGIDQRTGVSQPGQDRGELGFAAGRTGQSRILCRTSGGSRRRAGRSSCMNMRSEEHTSELQSLMPHLVCRLLLEKKNQNKYHNDYNETI